MKCEACGKEFVDCGCNIWCNVCLYLTNHSTEEHERSAKSLLSQIDDRDEVEEPDEGDYDESRKPEF
jgi:hypothetical protein